MKKRYGKIIFIIALAVLLPIITYFGSVSVLKSLYPTAFADCVENNCSENNLDINFIYAVIKCESNFDENAVSHVGARGLMQLMPETFLWLSEKRGENHSEDELFNPEINISYGCYFYRMLIDIYSSEETALAAYHAGMGNVDRWLQNKDYSLDGKTLYSIPFKNTKEYVSKVIKTKNIYQKLYDGKDE